MLNKQKGNMYPFVTHTWNVIKGKCPHDCEYCYMKRFPQGKLRFDEKELKTYLGKNNYIFVGSSCDMWAEAIPEEWIDKILNVCLKYPNNTYLFQSKNPKKFLVYKKKLEQLPKLILGTTIETNKEELIWKIGKTCPAVTDRQYYIGEVDFADRMVTIEPIMDFDLETLTNWFKDIDPHFVNIGADSKKHNLPEPSWEKIMKLKEELEKFTEVNLKDNLSRLQKKE